MPPDETRSADPASAHPHGDRAPETPRDPTPIRDPERYQILSEHGRGGLGRVSRAHDKEFGRDIAIKELLSRGLVNELRFVREAMITARLEHPGIVPVYEAGRWPDGTPFYAMKLVSGRPLRALLAERATVDERIGLLHHVIAVADAIAYAHGRHIIHRDLKPANVIVGDFGETVVIDWGLAKDLSDSAVLPRGDGVSPGDGLTSAGSVLGTPAYMAPEQERGEAVDQRADVFAIGAMLWELCALHQAPPADLAQRRRLLRQAGVDSDLATIIEKALAPDPARRYRDAGALAADLKAFKTGARIGARDYSLWAMLAHWTRRHRALAVSVLAASALAVAGVTAFVRNIAVERDRADRALINAQRERDRSKLSEAALVLDRDPNRAQDLLASFPTHTPQIALLTDRARQRSARQIIPTAARIDSMFRAPEGTAIDIVSQDGALDRLDPVTGTLTPLDHGVTEALDYRAGQAVYARRPPGGQIVQLATTASQDVIDVGPLNGRLRIAVLDDVTYVVDRPGALYRVVGRGSTVVDHGIHRIAGSGHLLVVCHSNGELDFERGGVVTARRRCMQTRSTSWMAVIGDDYVTLGEDGTLLLRRGGEAMELPTGITGEYEVALSSAGAVAVMDAVAGGGAWFVPPHGTQLAPGPTYPAQPTCLAADGNLVAWGYEDGTVIARDTRTGMQWDFHGHPDTISNIVIDAAHARMASASSREVRVWDIQPPPSTRIATLPCMIFHVEPSPDGADAALDCNDGGVRRWSRRTGAVTPLHQHRAYSFGVQWVRDQICSGGWGDGKLWCSSPDGATQDATDFHTRILSGLTATPDHQAVVFGVDEGKVWRVGRAAQVLYTHGGPVTLTAISANGRWLASCAEDGSIAVYDLTADHLIAQRVAHIGAFCGVSWAGDELWSFGSEGTLKRWAIRDGALTLRHVVQASAALRLVKTMGDSWVAVEGASTLLVSRDGATVALRIDAGRDIAAIDVSADRRYVVAGITGEIIVIDLARNALAALAVTAPIKQLRFLEPALIAFSDTSTLETLRVDALHYVPFVPVPEAANRASF